MTVDLARSILDRLRNEAHARGEDFQVVLARYGVERMLYRISISPYSEAFILKGAQLLYARAGERYRPTRDLDLLVLGSGDVIDFRAIFGELCELKIGDDALELDRASLRFDAIREDTDASGVRVRVTGLLGRTRIPIQVDVGTGDAITPAPVTIEFPSLLGMTRPVLKAYRLETVVAEKLESLTALGISTSRVKDIYDLWQIKSLFDLEPVTIVEAIQVTFGLRGTDVEVPPDTFTSAFYSDSSKLRLWEAFQSRANLVAPSLPQVCNELAEWFDVLLRDYK